MPHRPTVETAENLRHGPENERRVRKMWIMGAENMQYEAKNVQHGAKSVRHGAKNAWHDATNVGM